MLVVRDFKFIDRVEYQTEYLKTQGDWLQVGDRTFNTTDKASAAVTAENNTIYVIADTHIAFKEAIQSDHDIIFDLNGHSVTFTQSINVNTNKKFFFHLLNN